VIKQNNQVTSEILLVDPKTELRDAQVQDLSDATYHGNTSTRVRAAEHAEAGQCDIIIVTAGAAQKKGELLQPPFCSTQLITYLTFQANPALTSSAAINLSCPV